MSSVVYYSTKIQDIFVISCVVQQHITWFFQSRVSSSSGAAIIFRNLNLEKINVFPLEKSKAQQASRPSILKSKWRGEVKSVSQSGFLFPWRFPVFPWIFWSQSGGAKSKWIYLLLKRNQKHNKPLATPFWSQSQIRLGIEPKISWLRI